MKHMRFLGVVLLATLCLTFTGCGKKKPAGFPETVPFSVKVVDGSKPIEGAIVFFIHDGTYNVSGNTDAKGVAVMSTMLQSYTEKGAPAGNYRVRIEKEPLAEHWKTPEEQAAMDKGERDAYIDEWLAKCAELPREVPKIWKDFDKTPLTVEVPAGGGEVTFDVEGKAND